LAPVHRQKIYFVASRCGRRLAHALSGDGYPLVRAPQGLSGSKRTFVLPFDGRIALKGLKTHSQLDHSYLIGQIYPVPSALTGQLSCKYQSAVWW